MFNRKTIVIGLLLGVVLISVGVAQFRRGRQIDIEIDRHGVPDWKVDDAFKHDTFTFARVRYTSWGRGGWQTDYPDADLNFSYRLQELTSLKVNPKPIILDLTDERLFDYPWIYIIEPGGMDLTQAEVEGLRKYLLNGGFLMVDDFWGGQEYRNFYENIKRVFPDREPQELKLDHPIFHIVYDLKEKPQVPSIGHARNGETYEFRNDFEDDGSEVHYKGIFDDKGRMMVIICHNTDLGDGWEREGEAEEYFRKYSEPRAYPMGINIVFYAMTH